MSCNDACAEQRTEDREFIYFTGMATGAKAERDRIIQLLTHNASRCDFEQMGGAHSNYACYCWYLRAAELIKESVE